MNPKRILLIEDNPSDVALTRRALDRARICNELVVVGDGEEALEYLRRDATDLPALTLLDLKLPKLSGLEVLRRIRQNPRTRRMPVVILTSSKEERDIAAGYDLGANSYIQKPVDFEQFAAAVEQIGLYWLLVNEAPPSSVEGAG